MDYAQGGCKMGTSTPTCSRFRRKLLYTNSITSPYSYIAAGAKEPQTCIFRSHSHDIGGSHSHNIHGSHSHNTRCIHCPHCPHSPQGRQKEAASGSLETKERYDFSSL